MKYTMGDSINTTQGLMFYQCGIPFSVNTNPKYDKLGGKTLHWLQNNKGQDVLFWDKELKDIYLSDAKVAKTLVLVQDED